MNTNDLRKAASPPPRSGLHPGDVCTTARAQWLRTGPAPSASFSDAFVEKGTFGIIVAVVDEASRWAPGKELDLLKSFAFALFCDGSVGWIWQTSLFRVPPAKNARRRKAVQPG